MARDKKNRGRKESGRKSKPRIRPMTCVIWLLFLYLISALWLNLYLTNIPHDKQPESIVLRRPLNQKSKDRIETRSATLTAYLEPPNLSDWKTKPLPVRNHTPSDLKKIFYPKLNSCHDLPSQWPVDNYPEDDPFLPWIHDVFPTQDGTFIRFVAQNKRRCHSGLKDVSQKMQPQSSLFQHVPVKRAGGKYLLTSHEEADDDGMETRFICRFKPSMEETLSVHPFNYEYAGFRKGYAFTHTEAGLDNHLIWTSQLLFDCPVPPELRDIVGDGSSVIGDFATLFVDVIPIRTPPRYLFPAAFLPPKHDKKYVFDTKEEWGDAHFLPSVESSGRWENIPICKPSQQTYAPNPKQVTPTPNHTLVACTWASTTFQTRGNHTSINDGERRLLEWITFHLLSGFDHIYIYDNSGAFSDNANLKHICNKFPSHQVTWIDWPSKICNNNLNNDKDLGERSSQYAAEASCRLRFGPSTKWMASFDTDEYLVPMGNHTSMKDVLEEVEKDGSKILTFRSMRSNPRFSFIDESNRKKDRFVIDPIQSNSSFLQTYNCEREKPPKTIYMSAPKQIYQPDYVLHHFIHYSSVTKNSIMTKSEANQIGLKWKHKYDEKYDHISNEITQATMLHTKTLPGETLVSCRTNKCGIGFEWPDGAGETDLLTPRTNDDGYMYNCYVNERIESYWVPKLEEALGSTVRSII